MNRGGRWNGVVGALLLLFALSLMGTWTQAAGTLSSIRLSWLIPAAVLCSAGYLIFSSIWAFLVLASLDSSSPIPQGCGYVQIFRISIMSIAGLATPMNLGTDVMRSMLGKRYLQIEVASTATASILARECKFHTTLLLIPALVIVAGGGLENSMARLIVAFAGVSGLSLAFVLLRSDGAKRLARKLRAENLTDTIHQADRKIGWRGKAAFCALFASGFAAEWQALRICFDGLGISPDPKMSFVCFGLLYFLSRTPVLPLGVGIVETAGFAWLVALHIPSEKAGALVIVWGFLRITVPFFMAAVSYLAHPHIRRVPEFSRQ